MGEFKSTEPPTSNNTTDPVHSSSSLDPEFGSFLLVGGSAKSRSASILNNGSSGNSPRFASPLLHRESTRSGRSQESSTRRHEEIAKSSDSVEASLKQGIALDVRRKTASSFSRHGSCTSTCHALDPPRLAKDGMEWVWFPAGYWAERGLVGVGPRRSSASRKWFTRSPSRINGTRERLSGTSSDLATETVEGSPNHIKSIRTLTEGSDRVSSKGRDAEPRLGKFRMGFRYISPKYPHFISPSGDPEGMYCKTKRNIGNHFVPKPKRSLNNSLSTPKNYLTSQTNMLLEGASSYFERVQKGRIQFQAANPSFAVSHSPRSPASAGPRSRRFGLAPWHRRSSYESMFSVTSSVHNLLRGQTPVATPNSAGTYFGQDGRSYPKVEISDANNYEPTFLPSEARRVNTPPMSTETPGKETRGFFFGMTPVPDNEASAEARTTASNFGARLTVASPSPHLSPQTPSREWWEAELPFPLTPRKSKPKIRNAYGPTPVSQFELNIHEHLPNSPLCPRNLSHQDGGTGMCVYHGRESSAGFN